ncbi:MAG: hypothetical protein L0Z63_08805 [Actinobacteria bacterium]|nr:hypothetical protein [Actinomycetota bacterium]
MADVVHVSEERQSVLVIRTGLGVPPDHEDLAHPGFVGMVALVPREGEAVTVTVAPVGTAPTLSRTSPNGMTS